MSELKIRPLQAPHMQRPRARHPANPRARTEVCVTKRKTPTSQGGPYKTWSGRKSAKIGKNREGWKGAENAPIIAPLLHFFGE
jgi:hypothetical protein